MGWGMKPKVGDKILVRATVTRVDEKTITLQIGQLTPVTIRTDHPALEVVEPGKKRP
jgi:preprotein translocase subunit YajC